MLVRFVVDLDPGSRLLTQNRFWDVYIRFGPYFLEPVVAGLTTPTKMNPTPKPFIATMDT